MLNTRTTELIHSDCNCFNSLNMISGGGVSLCGPSHMWCAQVRVCACAGTANLHTKILDFRGLDSSIILILRCGDLMLIGSILKSLSQRILVGIILVGRLGVRAWLSEDHKRVHEISPWHQTSPRQVKSCHTTLYPATQNHL